MILVTLGTQKQSFTRLLDYIENSDINDEIIVQCGHTEYKSKKMKMIKFTSYSEMDELLDKASLIITHGGTGSIISALKKGKTVIGCARLEKYNEHIDNHQIELLKVFEKERYILQLTEENDINLVYKKSLNFKPKKYISNTENFIKNLEKEIDEGIKKRK